MSVHLKYIEGFLVFSFFLFFIYSPVCLLLSRITITQITTTAHRLHRMTTTAVTKEKTKTHNAQWTHIISSTSKWKYTFSICILHIPEVEGGLWLIFLHTVLVVDVQFLTITSSFSHLVWRQAKKMNGKVERIKMSEAIMATLFKWEMTVIKRIILLLLTLNEQSTWCVPLWFAYTHLEHFLHTSQAWSGSQNLPDLHRHSVFWLLVHALTVSWSGKVTGKRPCSDGAFWKKLNIV